MDDAITLDAGSAEVATTNAFSIFRRSDWHTEQLYIQVDEVSDELPRRVVFTTRGTNATDQTWPEFIAFHSPDDMAPLFLARPRIASALEAAGPVELEPVEVVQDQGAFACDGVLVRPGHVLKASLAADATAGDLQWGPMAFTPSEDLPPVFHLNAGVTQNYLVVNAVVSEALTALDPQGVQLSPFKLTPKDGGETADTKAFKSLFKR